MGFSEFFRSADLSGYCLLQPVVRGSMLRSTHSLLLDARTLYSDAAVQAGSSFSFPNSFRRSLFGCFRIRRITISLASVIRAHSKQCDAFAAWPCQRHACSILRLGPRGCARSGTLADSHTSIV